MSEMKTVRIPLPLADSPEMTFLPIRLPVSMRVKGETPTSKSTWKRFGRIRAESLPELRDTLSNLMGPGKRRSRLLRLLGGVERKKPEVQLRKTPIEYR